MDTPSRVTAPDFGGSQTIITSGNTIPVVSGTPTISFDIGLFRLEDYGCYATSGLPLSYSSPIMHQYWLWTRPPASSTPRVRVRPLSLSQAGDNHFSAASNVTLNVAISQDRSQTITFAAITDQNATMLNQTISLGATASSGLAVTYASSDTSVASVSGSTLTINALGTVTITASQSGGTDPIQFQCHLSGGGRCQSFLLHQ